jgi:hypothetical protein
MIDYSEAIEELRQFSADRDARRAAALKGWTPTSDRLPPDGTTALWYEIGGGTKYGVVVATIEGDYLDWGGDFSDKVIRYSHWMPLPELPVPS